MNPSLYDSDFYAWTNEQAVLLRAGNLAAADIENLAEEIECLGKRERRDLINRLRAILIGSLKCLHRPDDGTQPSSIRTQRREMSHILTDSPSLRPFVSEALDDAYTSVFNLERPKQAIVNYTRHNL